MYVCTECQLPFATADDAVEHRKKTGHGYKRLKDITGQAPAPEA